MSIEGRGDVRGARRLRLGMVGGGHGSFIGPVHRIASRIDDRYELVAGAFSRDPQVSRASGESLGLAPNRIYANYVDMAREESARGDPIDVVSIVTPNAQHYAAARAFLDAGIHVICDKPLTTTVAEAEDLAARAAARNLLFIVTYNYTGYPLVRHARALIASGKLGRVRVVQVEYAQDWLATPLETSGHRQAGWRTDPREAGVSGTVADIGTHAFQLAEFVAGQRCSAVCAELATFVPGRRLEDNAHILLRYENGARGILWASQVAVGNENGLRIRIYTERGGLAWSQEHPNQLLYSPLGEPTRTISRAGPQTGPEAAHATRVPTGHPEGYLEAFATIYRDAAELIEAAKLGRQPDPQALHVPTVQQGVAGMKFIEAAVRSNRAGCVWTPIP